MTMNSPAFIRGCLSLLVGLLSWVATAGAQTIAAGGHPLDPLSAAEIQAATKVLAASPQFPQGAQFVTMAAKEPLKSDVLAHERGAAVPRQAFAVILDRRGNRTF